MGALQKDIEMYPDSYSWERAQRLGVSRSGIRDAQYRFDLATLKLTY